MLGRPALHLVDSFLPGKSTGFRSFGYLKCAGLVWFEAIGMYTEPVMRKLQVSLIYREQANGKAYRASYVDSTGTRVHRWFLFRYGQDRFVPCIMVATIAKPMFDYISAPERFGSWGTWKERRAYVRAFIRATFDGTVFA